ncbi:MAG: class II D-tagatose-bisphosphate aldolase non-catalytic subunit [Aggregatilineaceae bacterium]
MAQIKRMIERVIALRQQGVTLTLLAVCPNSEAVLEAAVLAAARNNAPMLFAATLNQVDRDGGYTGWTPAEFVRKLRGYARQYSCHPALYPCLDHGGQWLKDSHTRDRLTFEQTTAEVKASITAMLEAGYALLHIDPTVDRTLDGPLPVETVVERSLDLIAYAEAERERLGLPPVAYEVGTEEVHGGLVELESFRRFLQLLQQGLAARGLAHAWPAFVVAQVGTDLHTTRFDRQAAAALYDIAAPYGTLVKGHYTDWVDNPADYPLAGMGGANVGPEFTAEEYDALLALERREQDLLRSKPGLIPSRFNATLAAAVDASNRWQKWLQPDERGKSLDALTPARREWLLKTGARYIWTDSSVVAARQRLYDNLRPIMGDPHQYVVEWIARAIERYIVAFHLFNARAYFQE